MFTDPLATHLDDVSNPSSSCGGTSGYEDIAAGAGVVLKDGDGKTIAVGALGPGTRFDTHRTVYDYGCALPFTLRGVPEVPFYSIEVRRRGGVTFSLADMKAKNWSITLSLGR